ncbi:MAG: cupredoxin domain-containing protein [Candidatus Nitrosocaldus sp.]
MLRLSISTKHIVLLTVCLFAVFVSIVGIIASEMLEPRSNYKETTYITLVFNSSGDIESIKGITGTNPLLVARSSTMHQLAITVKNLDDDRHQFVIDRVAMSKILGKGDEDTIYVSGVPEGSYKYRDGINNRVLGEFKVVKVTTRG